MIKDLLEAILGTDRYRNITYPARGNGGNPNSNDPPVDVESDSQEEEEEINTVKVEEKTEQYPDPELVLEEFLEAKAEALVKSISNLFGGNGDGNRNGN